MSKFQRIAIPEHMQAIRPGMRVTAVFTPESGIKTQNTGIVQRVDTKDVFGGKAVDIALAGTDTAESWAVNTVLDMRQWSVIQLEAPIVSMDYIGMFQIVDERGNTGSRVYCRFKSGKVYEIRTGRDEPANCIRFREIDKSTLTERMGCGGIRQTTFEDALLEDVGDTLA